MRDLLGDDWPGAWDAIPWHRPDDWRDVAGLLAWDVATLGAGWVRLEAAHQSPAKQASLRTRLDVLAGTMAADLPYLLGVGPTLPDAAQPQLPLELPDEPPLERLTERTRELSWRMYFWMTLEHTLDRALDRATRRLQELALRDRGHPGRSGQEFLDALSSTFPGGTSAVEVERWWHRRAAEDRSLGTALGEQVALQVELLLREQCPTVLPMLEEAIAVGVEDAALGGALHVVTHGGRPTALRLMSFEGRPRAPVAVSGDADTSLRELAGRAGRTARPLLRR